MHGNRAVETSTVRIDDDLLLRCRPAKTLPVVNWFRSEIRVFDQLWLDFDRPFPLACRHFLAFRSGERTAAIIRTLYPTAVVDRRTDGEVGWGSDIVGSIGPGIPSEPAEIPGPAPRGAVESIAGCCGLHDEQGDRDSGDRVRSSGGHDLLRSRRAVTCRTRVGRGVAKSPMPDTIHVNC